MTIASDLTRIKDAKAAIRQAIIDKGVEVPETELMDTYHEYIDQISGKPAGPTGDGTLADLKLALSTDNPAEYYPIGTEIPDACDGVSNPWIVAHYTDITMPDETAKPGVYLCRKFAQPLAQPWANSGISTYNSSTANTYLNSTYLTLCSEATLSAVNEVRIGSTTRTSSFSSTVNYINSKFFLMSATEVCGKVGVYKADGEPWELWKNRTGITPSGITPDSSTGNIAANSGRVILSANGLTQSWYLRTYDGVTGHPFMVLTDGSVNFNSGVNTANYAYLVACAVVADN